MLRLGEVELSSRLIVGTGRYADFDTMRACHQASGTQLVTLAIRRFLRPVCYQNMPERLLPADLRDD